MRCLSPCLASMCGNHLIIGRIMTCRAVGIGWAQGHMPTQYFGQQVLMPTQYFCYTEVEAKRLPTQCSRPSNGPEMFFHKIIT